MDEREKLRPMKPLPNLIFMSRWLQLPLYIGLIVAQGVYVFHFWVELVHLVEAAFGNQAALAAIYKSVSVTMDTRGAQEVAAAAIAATQAGEPRQLTETVIMLVVLGLIDVVMISNLLIMVIIGGYVNCTTEPVGNPVVLIAVRPAIQHMVRTKSGLGT